MDGIRVRSIDKEYLKDEKTAVIIGEKLMSFLEIKRPQNWYEFKEKEIIDVYGSMDNKILFDFKQTKAIVEILEQFHEKYPENEDLVSQLAYALSDLALKQDYDPLLNLDYDIMDEIIKQLRILNKKYPNCIKIVRILLFLLDYCIPSLEDEKRDKMIAEMNELESKYPDCYNDK